jgi:hypothetical protein
MLVALAASSFIIIALEVFYRTQNLAGTHRWTCSR